MDDSTQKSPPKVDLEYDMLMKKRIMREINEQAEEIRRINSRMFSKK